MVVEDDEGLQSQLRWCFDELDVEIAGNRSDAISLLRRHQPQVVILDLGLPPDPGGATEGLATLNEILALSPETKVIIATGNDDRSHAVKAIAAGAYDFYLKPVDPEALSLTVQRAFHLYELEQENRKLAEQTNQAFHGIIFASPEMAKVCRTIEKVAPSDITTLILGASGTGKELMAKAIHQLSSRSNKKLVAINCAAIPENLLESELFGYEKGAFTGAARQTKGRIEYADGGTLFLDEIGDLPYPLQAKLLRFLQERVLERVGGREEIPIDARVICATHQNIQDLIQAGTFREDLYYRISEITVTIPPLAEREGDAIILAKAFLHQFAEQHNSKVKGFTSDALQAIENHPWPGNVREIESLIKRAVILSDGTNLSAEDLGLKISEEAALPFNLKQVRDEAEKKAVLRALNHHQWNISQAARLLGITRPTLYTLMEKFDIQTSNESNTAVN